MANLKDLENLTKELSEYVRQNVDGTVTYMVDGGDCIGYNLLNNKDIAIQNASMKKGTNFPHHNHEEIEILVQYDGDAEITVDNNKTLLKPGDSIRILPNQRHSYNAITNVKLIGITIPSSKS